LVHWTQNWSQTDSDCAHRLTPGPLVVVLKVASSLVANISGYWPPAVPDSVETIGDDHVAIHEAISATV
jgi:hypothetical protein